MTTKNQREQTLQIRVTEEQYNAIDNNATRLGLVISNYMRMVCLHSSVDIRIEPKISKVNEKINEQIFKEQLSGGKKYKTCQMRVTDEESRIVQSKADALNLSLPNYMRMVCLNASIIVSLDN